MWLNFFIHLFLSWCSHTFIKVVSFDIGNNVNGSHNDNWISSVSAISFSITFKAILSFTSCKFCHWKTLYLRIDIRTTNVRLLRAALHRGFFLYFSGITFRWRSLVVNSSALQKRWPALGAKQPYQKFFQTISWKIFSMSTSSVFSINVSQIKCINSKEKSVPGEKKSKVWLTGMAAASATGEKLPMFVIWKSKNPRCFKNAKYLPCE